MKKLLAGFISTLLIVNVCHAEKVKNYKEAVELLSKGKRITMVVDFDKCQIDNNHGGKLTGLSIIRLPEVVIIRNNQISARAIIPEGYVLDLPELGAVYQSSTFTFNKNNQFHAELHVQDPVTYTDKLPATNIYCELGRGLAIYN